MAGFPVGAPPQIDPQNIPAPSPDAAVPNNFASTISGLQNSPSGQMPQAQAQQPGMLKRMLLGFVQGMGQTLQLESGVPQFQLQQREAESTMQTQAAQRELLRSQSQMIQTPYGPMPAGLAKVMFPALINSEGRQQVAKTNAQAKQDVATTQAQSRISVEQMRQMSPLQQAQAHLANSTADLKEAMNDPSSPAFKLAMQKVQWSNYYKQAALEMQQSRINFQQNGPTQNMRTQGQMAESLLQHLPDIKGEIASLGASGKLGPLSGRWEEFMAGKVGDGDPDYVRLRTDLGLLQTGLMKAHVGARGSEQIMNHFKGLIDSGKATPEMLNASIDSVGKWLTTYSAIGRTKNDTQTPQATHRWNPATQKIEVIK